MEEPARAALEWIDTYGDRDGDGYLEYQRTRDTGLENQCWKDSWNSIMFADGSLASAPRATCEIHGYVYDAKRRTARLARRPGHRRSCSSCCAPRRPAGSACRPRGSDQASIA